MSIHWRHQNAGALRVTFGLTLISVVFFLASSIFFKISVVFLQDIFDDLHSALKEAAKDHNLVPSLLILKSCQCQAFRHQIHVSMPCACIHLPLPLSSGTFHLISFLRRTRPLLLPSLHASCSLVKTFAEEMLVVCKLVVGKQPKLTTEALINYELSAAPTQNCWQPQH